MSWFRAHQLTRPMPSEEVRLREDGDYDVREAGNEEPYDSVPLSFFDAEFCTNPDCEYNTCAPIKMTPVDTRERHPTTGKLGWWLDDEKTSFIEEGEA